MTDEDFLAAAAKAHLQVAPTGGTDMQREIAAAYAAQKPIVARARELMGRAGKEIASPKSGQPASAHQG
jgi:hypothetical protein